MKSHRERLRQWNEALAGVRARQAQGERGMSYAIMIDLPGSPDCLELCKCETPEKLAAVVLALLNSAKHPPSKMIIEVREE